MNKLITERQQAFLDAYRYSGMVKEAAETIGCSRELHYGAMRTSEAYREAFALVQCDVAVELEEEARRRAVDGVKVPILYRGKVIGYDTRRSDALLIFLLEANNPEKFAGIKEELGRNKDFGVRWDREEVGRPTLSRMMGPLPPMPPRPPRPPRPPVGEWGGDEALEGTVDVGTGARSEPDPELIRRWAAMDLSPCESGLRNAPPLESDGVDQENAAEMSFEMDVDGGDDSDAGFCVRWEEAGHDQREMESARLPRPRAFRRASTRPTERLFEMEGEERSESDVGLCVRWRKAATWATRCAFADCRPRLNRVGSRAPPDHALGRACYTAPFPSRTPTIGVAAHIAQPIVPRRPGPGRSSGAGGHSPPYKAAELERFRRGARFVEAAARQRLNRAPLRVAAKRSAGSADPHSGEAGQRLLCALIVRIRST